jgi:hypothetical protein
VPSLSVITREVDDVLRYTIVLPHGDYTAGVRSVIDGLTGEAQYEGGGVRRGAGIATNVYTMNYWNEKVNCTTYLVWQTGIGSRRIHHDLTLSNNLSLLRNTGTWASTLL